MPFGTLYCPSNKSRVRSFTPMYRISSLIVIIFYPAFFLVCLFKYSTNLPFMQVARRKETEMTLFGGKKVHFAFSFAVFSL